MAHPQRIQQVLGGLVPATSLLAMLMACLDLSGWVFGLEGLVRVIPMPGSGIMMPNTVVGLLLSSAALWLARRQKTPPWRRGLSHALAAGAVLLGLLTLSEYIFGTHLGIDLLLFREAVTSMSPHLPGRPAPMTALCFVLTGLALRILDAETDRGHRPAQLLALATGFLGSLVLLGYLYGEQRLFAPGRALSPVPPFTPMALHTALAFVMLALGLLAARPDRGLMALVTGDDAGGLMTRRLLPAAILVPVVAGWLRLLGEQLGLYGTAFGISLFVIMTTSILLLMILWNAAALHRLDVMRHEAERVLRVSKGRLSGIVSGAADAIISTDAQQRITLFNEGAEHIFGYPAGEILGQPLGSLIPARLRQLHEQHFWSFAAGAPSARRMGKRQPILGMRKNGEEFPAEASISKIEVEGTQLFTVILRDSTERKRAEEALRESEERFRAAYENAPIGMALVGLDGRFLNINRSFCAFVGYPEQELLTKTFQDITDPADLEADLANVRQLLAGALRSYQMEKRYIHKGGHTVPVLLTASLVHDARGEPSYFIAQALDISEQKRLEQELRFLAGTGLRLADSLDPKTTLAAVAQLIVPALADWCLIGLLDDEERVLVMKGEATSADNERTLQALLAAYSQEPAPLAARVLPAGELAVPLIARGNTLGAMLLGAAASGRQHDARSLALAEELARRAALAIDNARLYKKAGQATRIRDEVLRIVAHDLRTPLQVISLSAELLQGRLLEEPLATRRPLDTILRSVARANRLIQDLLDAARMEAGRLSVERRPEQLSPLLKEVLELHRALAEAKSLQLTASLPEDEPFVLADRDRLLQVFSNLLGNALKFTPQGGRITLRAEYAGDMMRFSVSDTGPGIPAESLPHIFEPFWQVRAAREEGAGLGLAIAKGLVEAHGGHLWAESQPGAGSTFFFTLPLAAPAGAPEPGPYLSP